MMYDLRCLILMQPLVFIAGIVQKISTDLNMVMLPSSNA